jgi:hypothetical protein
MRAGDTFPVGCRHDDSVIYHRFFAENPDSHDERYNTQLGVYSQGCGLSQVDMSWGHDEYMYRVRSRFRVAAVAPTWRFHLVSSAFPREWVLSMNLLSLQEKDARTHAGGRLLICRVGSGCVGR